MRILASWPRCGAEQHTSGAFPLCSRPCSESQKPNRPSGASRVATRSWPFAPCEFRGDDPPGELVVFSMHETWTVDWEGAEWVSLCFPRDLDLRLSTGLAALGPGLLHGPGPGLLADFMLALPARLAKATAEEIPVLAGAMHGTISACLLTGASQPAGLSPGDAAAGLARERVRRAILREIGSGQLKPAILAREAGLSRSSLYRLFENDGGVARYIQQVRLAMAHDALRDPVMAGRTIGVIAKAHGFPSPLIFRAFRAAYGLSPREARSGLSRERAPCLRTSAAPRRHCKGPGGPAIHAITAIDSGAAWNTVANVNSWNENRPVRGIPAVCFQRAPRNLRYSASGKHFTERVRTEPVAPSFSANVA